MTDVRKRTLCNDGFSMSIQASDAHYCSPRVDGLVIYDEYEIMCAPDPLLKKYDQCGVYGYVPLSVVAKLIKKHGGIKGKVQ